MHGIRRVTTPLVGLLFLASCAGTALQKAEEGSARQSTFDRALHDGYMNLAESEYDQADYIDSDKYAERAMALADGENVQPEMIEARNLPVDKVSELSAARLRLTSAMAEGSAETKPFDAATAQTSFDCWMEQQEENFQTEHIAACRDAFMMSVAKLEEKPQVAAAPQPAPQPAPMPAPTPAAFTVHFDFDKAELTSEARTVLSDVAQSAQKSGYQKIDVGGYTDLVGSEIYNDVLSEQRANAVIDFLVQSGVAKEKIVGAAYGKADPVVSVQQPEMRNRRVEIRLEP
jgi:OOP family OmpA-OmpF porin